MNRTRPGQVLLAILFVSTLAGCVDYSKLSMTADRIPAVDQKMQEFVDKGEISGVVTLVATKDKVMHLSAVGKTDLATDRKMQENDVFWIASMTKPIAAVAIGILKDEGKLSFDDPVEKHLPEFAAITVMPARSLNSRVGDPPGLPPSSRPSRPITLRDVMTHTSGLGEINTRQPHWTLAELSQELAKTQLRFEPGTRWQYSTAGIDILGRVVEVVSGQPFDVFLQKRVFNPLGMNSTSFWITEKTEERWARPYRWNPQTSTLEPTTISYLYNTPVTDRQRAPGGGAGLFSTAIDICRFYQMMLNKGELNGKRILKPETVAEMTRKQTGNLTARPGMPWGLGFCVIEDPNAMEANKVVSPGTFGHGGAYSTQSWADPTKNLIWVVMFQRNNRGNPDNTDVRIAFQAAALPAIGK